jgi:ADP-ribose pyrophosphatase
MSEDTATVLSSETAWAGRIFTVMTDRVRLPNGHESTLEVVRHPGAVVLLPMPDDEHVILVRQYRYAVNRWVWELAAGSLEPGEEPAEGAARECQEEVGVIAGRLEFLGAFYPTPGYCDELMHFFKLTALREPDEHDEVAEPDEDEDIRVEEFSLDQVRAMIREGEIVDLKTAVALTLLGR